MPAGATPPRNRAALRLLLASLGLGVLAWLAWHSRHDLATLVLTSDPAWLLAAMVVGVVFTMTQGILFADLIGKHVPGRDPRSFVAAFLLSQPGKYVPGKIWSPLLQAFALRRSVTFTSVAIANVELAVIATIQVTALGIALLHANVPLVVGSSLGAGLLLGVAVAMLPTRRVIAAAFPRLAARFGLAPGQASGRCPFPRTLLVCAAGIATNFAASYMVLHAAGDAVSASARGAILGSLYLGFAVSMLAIPIPAGLGVREAAAAAIGSLVTPGIPASLIVSVAVFFRCWQIFVDVACLALGLLMARPRSTAGRGEN